MYPQTNLQFGQSGDEVRKLQDFLISQGFTIPSGPTGYFGNETKNALTQWQKETGVDAGEYYGYWGPLSQSMASWTGKDIDYTKGMDESIDEYNARIERERSGGTRTDPNQPYTDEEYADALNNNPVINEYVAKGNTVDDLEYAVQTGDLSNLVNQFGQPFSLEDQQEALAQAEEDNKLYYEALESKETADAESALARQKADYQNYLLTSGQEFESDKAKADQSAADRGVLFSGGRVQREKNLARAYEQDQATKQASAGRNISDVARDYQYRYGDDAAGTLSKYYNLGSNTYNPNAARNNVKSGSLSSIYDPSQYDYQGTQNVARKTAAQKRAAGYLWNKGNKLLASGYKNKY